MTKSAADNLHYRLPYSKFWGDVSRLSPVIYAHGYQVPIGELLLLSARPVFIFPSTEHQCFVKETRVCLCVCEHLAQNRYVMLQWLC